MIATYNRGWGNFMKRICFVAPLIILAACATPTLRTPTTGSLEVAREAALQRKFVIEKQRDQWITLTRVMYRLSTAAADLCGVKVSGAVGMAMMTAKEFPGEYEAVARSEFGFDNGFTVVAVMPDSPAQGGGLEAGDRIISVDGTAIAASPADSKVLQASLKRDAAAQTPLTMVIRRNGVDEALKITPDRVCDYQAGISNDNEINAFADGSRVVATKGLMNFVKSDEELALVLSHEISHNVLDHIGKQRKNAALGGAAG